jgi:hypothetical protein
MLSLIAAVVFCIYHHWGAAALCVLYWILFDWP